KSRGIAREHWKRCAKGTSGLVKASPLEERTHADTLRGRYPRGTTQDGDTGTGPGIDKGIAQVLADGGYGMHRRRNTSNAPHRCWGDASFPLSQTSRYCLKSWGAEGSPAFVGATRVFCPLGGFYRDFLTRFGIEAAKSAATGPML